MNIGITDKVVWNVDRNTVTTSNNNYKSDVHRVMIDVLKNSSIDYTKAISELNEKFEVVKRTYDRICDILVEKNYIKKDHKGIYQIEPLTGEDTERDYMDILATADVNFTAARDIKDRFEDHVRWDTTYSREYFESKSILAGICLLMNTLINEVSSYPECCYGARNK